MVDRTKVLLLVGGVLFSVGGYLNSQDSAPLIKPEGPDMVLAFSGGSGNASRDAADLAAICSEFADVVEQDQSKPEPRIQLGVQLDDLRLIALETQLDGTRLSAMYPNLPKIVGEFLDKEIGTSGGKLDKEQAAKWVKAYRTLAECSLYASKKL